MIKVFKNLLLERQDHPDLSIFEPFDVVWEYREKPMTEFHADIHYALQITVVLYGEVEMIFDNFQRTYQSGDIFFTSCWEPHGYKLTKRRTFMLSINMNIENLGQCAPFTYCDFMLPFITEGGKIYSPESAMDRCYISETAKKIFHLFVKKMPNYHYHDWLLIHQLLLFVIEKIPNTDETAKNDFKRIKNAVDLVRTTQGKAPLLEEAAAACQLSPSRFSTLFRNSIGMSYGQFALHGRLSKAAEELLYTDYSMNELAERWGFYDNSSFSNAFYKVFFCRPGSFKKNRLNNLKKQENRK